MKKCLVILFCMSFASLISAQTDSVKTEREYVFYSFFVNVVPDGFNLPLIGFVNIAKGNYSGVEIGFVNANGKDLNGAQIGFVNTVIGKTNGSQVGFVNTSVDSVQSAQIGFVNLVGQQMDGGQVGFVNATKSLRGIQLGFVNYADTLESGVPIGFISIVRKGGYQALELSLNELYPYNVSFKTGVTHLYSSIEGSFNPNFDNRFAFGLGLGSIIPLSSSLYFNPEVISQSNFSSDNEQTLRLSASVAYDITPKLQVLGGPDITWQYNIEDGNLNDPYFSFHTKNQSGNNRLIFGAKVAVRYNFNPIRQ